MRPRTIKNTQMRWYLIECEEDGYICVVPGFDIISAKKCLQIEDDVDFEFDRDVYSGNILDFSVDYDTIIGKYNERTNNGEQLHSRQVNEVNEASTEKQQNKKKNSRKTDNSEIENLKKANVKNNQRLRHLIHQKPTSVNDDIQETQETNGADDSMNENAKKPRTVLTRSTSKRHFSDVAEDASASSDSLPKRLKSSSFQRAGPSASNQQSRGMSSNAKEEQIALEEMEVDIADQPHHADEDDVLENEIENESESEDENHLDDEEEDGEDDEEDGFEEESENSDESDRDDEDQIIDVLAFRNNPIFNSQLFGEHYPGAEMKHIGFGIFCKANRLHDAIFSSDNERQCSRKCMRGVFTQAAIEQFTIAGRGAARRNDEENAPDAVEQTRSLNGLAVHAILTYAKEKAGEMKWPEMTRQVVRAGMTQNVTDLRNATKKGRLNNKPFKYWSYVILGNSSTLFGHSLLCVVKRVPWKWCYVLHFP